MINVAVSQKFCGRTANERHGAAVKTVMVCRLIKDAGFRLATGMGR